MLLIFRYCLFLSLINNPYFLFFSIFLLYIIEEEKIFFIIICGRILLDANTFFKNMKHAEIECPVCEKLKKDCKKVYYDEWHDEYVCKKCGLVIKK